LLGLVDVLVDSGELVDAPADLEVTGERVAVVAAAPVHVFAKVETRAEEVVLLIERLGEHVQRAGVLGHLAEGDAADQVVEQHARRLVVGEQELDLGVGVAPLERVGLRGVGPVDVLALDQLDAPRELDELAPESVELGRLLGEVRPLRAGLEQRCGG